MLSPGNAKACGAEAATAAAAKPVPSRFLRLNMSLPFYGLIVVPKDYDRKARTGNPNLKLLIFLRSQSEFLDQRVRDRLAGRESDAGLGGFQPRRGNVAGMRLDGGRRQIKSALLAERGITRDDGFSDPEPWHLVGDDFFGVRQCARKLRAQS